VQRAENIDSSANSVSTCLSLSPRPSTESIRPLPKCKQEEKKRRTTQKSEIGVTIQGYFAKKGNVGNRKEENAKSSEEENWC
jgi:hypothetical protein